MPFSRPTLSELRAQTAQDVAASTGAETGLLRRAVLRVLSDIQAAMAHLHYGYLDWIARQAVPFTCTDEYLEGWAALKGVFRKPATAATGTVTLTGTPGTVVPAGTPVIRADGTAYTVATAAAVGSGGTVAAPILADEAGAAGNADAGAVMVLGRAVAGVQSTGAAAAAVIGGADLEADDDLRARMLAAYQITAQGGDADDFVGWALAVPGVTRAWVLRSGAGPGTVVLYVMLDDAQAAHGGFPQGTDGVAAADIRAVRATGDQLTVANALWSLQPVTALVYVVAPVNTPVPITISGIPAASRTAVSAALVDQFAIDAAPGGTIPLNRLWEAVEAVSGVDAFRIVSPAADLAAQPGRLFTVGTITWS